MKQNLKTTLLLGWVSLSRLHHASTFSPAKAGCDLYLVRVRFGFGFGFRLGFGLGLGLGFRFGLPFDDQLLEVAGSHLPRFRNRGVLSEQVEELVV